MLAIHILNDFFNVYPKKKGERSRGCNCPNKKKCCTYAYVKSVLRVLKIVRKKILILTIRVN